MKTTIVFFDTPGESANGTLRGLISLLVLLPTYYGISRIDAKLFPFSNGTPFWILAMSSGIGVIQPNNLTELLFFGMCIGGIMLSVHSFWLFNYKKIKDTLISLFVGIVLGFISSMSLWYIYWNNSVLRIPAKYNIVWQILNACIFLFILYLTDIIK